MLCLIVFGFALARTRTSLDIGWKFKTIVPDMQNSTELSIGQGVAPGDKCKVPECQPSTDDDSWRSLNIPHDFVVEGVFDPHADVSHGFLPYGSGWYRLRFDVPAEWKGQAIWIDFDGVQRNSSAFLNGVCVGTHDSGYTSFRYQLGVGSAYPLLNYGGSNLLAVYVDATAPDGWWYDGGGIYRHVWLNSASALHIAPWGVYLPASVSPQTIQRNSEGKLVGGATVTVLTSIENKRTTAASFTVNAKLYNSTGDLVAQGSVDAQASADTQTQANLSLQLSTALLWSLEHPHLYRAVVRVLEKGEEVDVVEENFGVRSLRWDAKQGFFLNEQPVKIKGMANHQDFAGVGVAVPDSLQEYRILSMRAMGANAWRTAHNPPNPELLDAADRLGFLVWDENHRNRASGGQWVEDMDSLILRDRNHPSVIIWSICNEVLCENFNTANAKSLKERAMKWDPQGQRVVSAAMNGKWETSFSGVLDLVGFNYNIPQYDTMEKLHPTYKYIGSETASDVSDRGIYENDPVRAYVSAYDVNHPSWAETSQNAWCPIFQRPFIAGCFVWTGFDYKGEPTPYKWPNINSHFGVIDIAGFPKDNFYYYKSVWTTEPMVHVFPHWNWDQVACKGICQNADDGKKIVNVWAYTNGDAVELFVNGVSQGRQNYSVCRHVEWNVTYAPGSIKAVAYKQGKVHATETITTTGAVSDLALVREFPSGTAPLAANGVDIALIHFKLLDANGQVVPTGNASVTLTVTGPAVIIGLGNGDPSSHEADKPRTPSVGVRSAWNGLGLVVVQNSGLKGTATLTATAPSLPQRNISIDFQ